FRSMSRWLRVGGQCLFSMNDPSFTAKLAMADHSEEGAMYRRHLFLGYDVLKVHRSFGEVELALAQANLEIDASVTLADRLIRAFVCTRRENRSAPPLGRGTAH